MNITSELKEELTEDNIARISTQAIVATNEFLSRGPGVDDVDAINVLTSNLKNIWLFIRALSINFYPCDRYYQQLYINLSIISRMLMSPTIAGKTKREYNDIMQIWGRAVEWLEANRYEVSKYRYDPDPHNGGCRLRLNSADMLDSLDTPRNKISPILSSHYGFVQTISNNHELLLSHQSANYDYCWSEMIDRLDLILTDSDELLRYLGVYKPAHDRDATYARLSVGVIRDSLRNLKRLANDLNFHAEYIPKGNELFTNAKWKTLLRKLDELARVEGLCI